MDSDSKQLDVNRATYPQTQPRRLVLPPLQVKRSLNPNSNYYRKISAEFHKREALLRNKQHPASPIHKRISILEDITEEGNGTRRHQSYKSNVAIKKLLLSICCRPFCNSTKNSKLLLKTVKLPYISDSATSIISKK